MALNPSGAISLGGPSAGQSIALELGLSATAQISLNDTDVRTLAQVPSGTIIMPTDFWGKSNITGTQKAIFGYGSGVSPAVATNVTNLVSNTGVMAADTPGVGTARNELGAAGYGGDKAIFGFGDTPTRVGMTNLVSNTGVVASDTPAVGTARNALAAATYGGDKAIFGFGATPVITNITNLVSNTGVVASDTPGVGTVRRSLGAAGYGGDKAIFGYGLTPAGVTSLTNLVSNTGVVASDTPGVGTARNDFSAAGYGGDKAIFGFGNPSTSPFFSSITNLVSNTGVVASDTPNAVQIRRATSSSGYGGDKAIFGFGDTPLPANSGRVAITNLVSNTGVLASDTPGAPGVVERESRAAAGYSFT